MRTCKLDFFDVTDSGSGTPYIAAMSIHLQKVLWHELDATFIKSKAMLEVASVRYRCGGLRGRVDVSLASDEPQRRYRVPDQNYLRVL